MSNAFTESRSSSEWSDSDLIRLYQAKANFIPYQVIAEQLARTPGACEHQWRVRDKWIRRLDLENDPSQKTLSRSEAKQAEVEKLDTRINTRLELNRVRADVLADRLSEVVSALPTATPPIYKSPPRSRNKDTSLLHESEEDAGLLLSDLHIGLKYTKEETGGLAEYGIPTFLRRLDNLKKGVTSITELHSKLYRIPRIHIFMIGDNAHGMNDVGKWSAAYIESSIIDQVFQGVNSLSEMIYYLLGLYDEVCIYGVGGNHGRAAEKGKEKDYVNWDYIIYKFLEFRFANNPRVKIEAPKAWFIQTTIRNHRFLLVHGDDVKGGNFPIQSLVKVQDKVAGLVGRHPHYVLAGHFHSAAKISTNNGRVYINGAFTGPDPHSLKNIQAGGKPEQLFFGINNRHGITWEYNIDLEAKRD
jgi:hypothetical protein